MITVFPSDPNLFALCDAYKSAALHCRNTMGRVIMEAPVLSSSALYYQRSKFLKIRTSKRGNSLSSWRHIDGKSKVGSQKTNT